MEPGPSISMVVWKRQIVWQRKSKPIVRLLYENCHLSKTNCTRFYSSFRFPNWIPSNLYWNSTKYLHIPIAECVERHNFFFRKMAGSIGKKQILSIYKQLLRESQKFDSYNFRWVPVPVFGFFFYLIYYDNKEYFSNISNRNYALRRVKDGFKGNKSLSRMEDVNKQFKCANENLDIIKRQVNSALNCWIGAPVPWWTEKCLKWNIIDLISGDNWQNVFIGSIGHWNRATIG